MKKYITLILGIFIIFSTAVAFAEPLVSAQESSRTGTLRVVSNSTDSSSSDIFVEAESMTFGSNVAEINDSDASGKKAVCVVAETDMELKDIDDSVPPCLNTVVNIPHVGQYAVWVRFKANNGSSDSFHYSLNNRPWATKHNDSAIGLGYQWARVDVIAVSGNTLEISFKYREPNFIFDKLFITDDTSVIPVGVNGDKTVNTINTEDYWPTPAIKPISGHPRLFVTPDYVNYIKSNLSSPEWQTAYKKVTENGNDETIAAETIRPDNGTAGNYSSSVSSKIQCRALLWLLGDVDEEHARNTIRYAREYLSTVTYPNIGDITRAKGDDMVMGAIVYDWCYDLLTDDDKKFFINIFKYMASIKECGYPPIGTGHQIGEHDGEGEIFKDLLSAGVAVYDEDPEMYNLAAGRLFDQMIESRNVFYHAGRNYNGTNYGIERTRYESYAALIFDRMGYKDLFDKDENGNYRADYGTENMRNMPYTWIYERLPFGLFIKEGNCWTYTNYKYENGYSNAEAAMMLNLSGVYDDPYIRGQWVKQLSLSGYSLQPFWNIIIGKPDQEFITTPDDLPLTRVTGYPMTAIEARTNWQDGLDSPTVVASMIGYEKLMGEHEHMDLGSFSIYYKGTLTMDGGRYNGDNGKWFGTHFMNYLKQSIASNTMNVYLPDEQFDYYVAGKNYDVANSGGQKIQGYIKTMDDFWATEDIAATDGVFVGPNEKTPEFSYIKTDLSNAYGEKVSYHDRSMVFMNLFDEEYPAVMVVYDNITATDSSAKKAFLMQSIEEPSISGNKSVIERTADERFTGRLTNITMLPKNPSIVKVGGEGKDSFVDGTNYPNASEDGIDDEQGAWRLEISPSSSSYNDIFLNAMYVSDGANKNLEELPMYQEDFTNFVGVTVKDRVVLFSKTGEPVNTTSTITIRENDAEQMSCLITDVAEGVWKVESADSVIYAEVKDGENALCFKGVPGEYTISKAVGQTATKFDYPETEFAKTGDFLLYKGTNFIYQEKPTKLIDGVPYVPMKAIFERLGAEVTWNESDNSINITKNERTMTVSPDSLSAVDDGVAVTLAYAPKIINGVAYGAFEDYTGVLACTYSYDDYADIMKIYSSSIKFVPFTFTPANEFFERVSEEDRIVSAGTNYRFKVQDEDTEFSIPDGGYIKFYNNRKELGKITVAGAEVNITLSAGENSIYAKLFRADGTEIGRSKTITITADFYNEDTVLVNYDWDTNQNGNLTTGTKSSIDFEHGMSNKIIAPGNYKTDGTTPERVEYLVYRSGGTANFLEYSDDILVYEASYYFDDFNVDRNICYTGGSDVFQVTVAENKGQTTTNLLVGTPESGNSYSAGTVAVKELKTDTWYIFRRIFNTSTGVAILYIDDEFVHQEKYDALATSDIREFKNADFSIGWDDYAPGDTACYYIDNVKVSTLEHARYGVESVICGYTDVPAGTELVFSVSSVVAEENTLSYYVNGKRKGTVENNEFTYTIQPGENEIYVQIDDSDKKSPTTVVNGINYIVDTVYYDVDFAEGIENLKLISIDGANAVGNVVNGKYQISVSENVSSTPMLRMADWNSSPNRTAGVYVWEVEATYGKFHYGKNAEGNNIGTSRYPIKVNLPYENNKRIPLFYLDWWPSDSIQYGVGNLKINNVDTGIDVKAGETHTYKVVLDTENGVCWFYFDGKLIAQETDFAKGAILGRTDFEASPLAGTTETFDNIKLYKLSNVNTENRYTYTSGGVEINSFDEIDLTKEFAVNALIYNDGTANKLGLFSVIKKKSDNSLVSVKYTPILFEENEEYQIKTSVFTNLPSDIKNGGYTLSHYLWEMEDGYILKPLNDVVEGLLK